MMPSVSGGLGHLSRTAMLGRALLRHAPDVEIAYVLDGERLRPFNLEAARATGFPVRVMPKPGRGDRDAIIRDHLGDADAIVDDTQRYLVPYRQVVPRAAWISIPMHPLFDELFLDWPFLVQMDAVIWAYPEQLPVPEELEIVRDRLHVTGPFLDVAGVPERDAARAALDWAADDVVMLYAPRGFPFGRTYGLRALSRLVTAAAELRRTSCPSLRLVLTAVDDPDLLAEAEGWPAPLPPWIELKPVLPRSEAMLHQRGADAVVAEGTSTMHEVAALGAPLLLMPGPIAETTNLAGYLARCGAGVLVEGEGGTGGATEGAPGGVPEGASGRTTGADMLAALDTLLGDPAAARRMAGRALAAVTSGGGVDVAAELVLGLARRAAAAHGKGETAWRMRR